jgi:hypothetical protein
MSYPETNYFEQLNSIDVSEHTEKKGNFTYLSWAWAVRELLKVDPTATWEVHEWGIEGNRQPYMQTEAGCFVKVTVWVGGIQKSQVHPVLDNRNQTIEKPNAFQVNTSIQRCLAKAIALHGLGLYIFAGEDLPSIPKLYDHQENDITAALGDLKDDDEFVAMILKKVEKGEINQTNFKVTMKALDKRIRESES